MLITLAAGPEACKSFGTDDAKKKKKKSLSAERNRNSKRLFFPQMCVMCALVIGERLISLARGRRVRYYRKPHLKTL